MSAFFDYLRNITYYLLFATLIGMAAPSGKYKKYVSLVTGLVLVLLMVKPLQSIAGQGLPVTQWFSGIVSAPPEAEASGGYGQMSYNQISKAFEDQLFAQVSALLSQEGYTLQSASFEYAGDFSALTSMGLTVQAGEDAEKKSSPLIRIDPVKIGGGASPDEEQAEEDAEIARIKKVLADFYAPNPPHINVKTE